MSYLVLARKYRPTDFESVKGQEHVTRTLKNAIARGKISHAFLFTGPRGVGKTSISRILAKALNCQRGLTAHPCGECATCEEVARGASMAVREIDGASHNGVENVRDLIESVRSMPAPGYRYKVFIIDEVHMLSLAAFNALLKCLEEPPPHTVFILATTEVHKIPDTVISRCQRHDFRALSTEDVIGQLNEIVSREGLTAEPGALALIARLSEGSMRDAQSLLDRVQTYCEECVTERETSEILGVVDRAALDGLSRAVIQRAVSEALTKIDAIFDRGVDPSLLAREFASFWHELLLLKFRGGENWRALGLQEVEFHHLKELLHLVSERDLQDLAEIAREGAERALRSSQPRFAFEALVVRMACREPVRSVAELLSALQKGDNAKSDSPSVARFQSPAAKGGRSKPAPEVTVSLLPEKQALSSVECRRPPSSEGRSAAPPAAVSEPAVTVSQHALLLALSQDVLQSLPVAARDLPTLSASHRRLHFQVRHREYCRPL